MIVDFTTGKLQNIQWRLRWCIIFYDSLCSSITESSICPHFQCWESKPKSTWYGLKTTFSFTVNLSGEALAVGICPSYWQYKCGSVGQPHLVALRVEWRLVSGHAHHCMCPALPGGPVDLPHVEAPGVANAPPDAVGALGYWVPVEGHLVILLGKNLKFYSFKTLNSLFFFPNNLAALLVFCLLVWQIVGMNGVGRHRM